MGLRDNTVANVARVGAAVALLGTHLLSAASAEVATDPLTGLGKRPELGGTYRPPGNPPIASSGNVEILRHRDFAGKPCLNVGGFARPFATNRNLFDHVISAENSCPKSIKLQVCYFKTTQCLDVEVSGYGRKDVVLGTMPSQKDFRFEFREKF